MPNEREQWARENWDRGLVYDAWKASMTRNRDRVEANERRVAIDPADRAAVAQLPEPLRVVVIAADWCGDVVANLPVLARLSNDTGKLELRVFERDQEPSPIHMYLNRGQFKSIPVFAFFDRGWNEVGVFIERPASVTERRAQKRREIFAADSEFGSPDDPVDQLPDGVRARLQEALQRMRDDMADWANAEVIRELRTIIEKAA